MVLNSAQFIVQHKDDDVHTLALKKMPEGVDAKWALQQIEGYQLAKKKLPTWATAFESSTCGVESEGGIIFSPRISMEQCSSELTARYKAQLSPIVNCKSSNCKFLDLTGGFGVDFSYMAQGFRHAVYVEQNEELCLLAEHNFGSALPSGKSGNIEVHHDTAEHFLQTLTHADLIYIDPARRSKSGSKVFRLEDCEPNLLQLLPLMREKASAILMKLSPMLDIAAAVRLLAQEECHLQV
ncbi:MAG: SAM-dependent methyltransferase, partial [Prevotella sp.]|nr:SAM-dependent methyltransferase [Prevotella sp.]